MTTPGGHHPGSTLDAVAQAFHHQAPPAVPEVEVIGVSGPQITVPVEERLPALGRGYVVVLSANNPVLPILPQDPLRRSAVVLAVDNDVYLANTRDDAQLAAGTTSATTAFYLPVGVALPIMNTAAWYVAATSAAQARVSVLPSMDAT